jgi:hypothetical protein
LGGRVTADLAVLYTDGAQPDWPDRLDPSTGRFIYYGDNRKPGQSVDAPLGNQLLRDTFDALYANPPDRPFIPPYFAFAKATAMGVPAGTSRAVVFLGLAVPGASDLESDEDFVAVWRSRSGRRFMNYRPTFSILDASSVSREWLDSVIAGKAELALAPRAFRTWIKPGRYVTLTAPPIAFPSPAEQQPWDQGSRDIVRTISEYFKPHPTRFEPCAARLWQMMARERVTYEITRPVIDFGRDAIGEMLLGPSRDAIRLDFALEAKCYGPTTAVTTRHTSRLNSRLRHRQFGVLVTTSFVARQAYKELREDRQPLVIMAAWDIAETLQRAGYRGASSVGTWLRREFP